MSGALVVTPMVSGALVVTPPRYGQHLINSCVIRVVVIIIVIIYYLVVSCDCVGGTDSTEWEDISMSTQMTLANHCASFTSAVSARFVAVD